MIKTSRISPHLWLRQSWGASSFDLAASAPRLKKICRDAQYFEYDQI
ncbi:hypothetical protein AGROH133_12151 [Agrobacterium tumefaciens]|nr:hypothetical protein AGROH133_12151 [Agrobacterium tumefaciens]